MFMVVGGVKVGWSCMAESWVLIVVDRVMMGGTFIVVGRIRVCGCLWC